MGNKIFLDAAWHIVARCILAISLSGFWVNASANDTLKPGPTSCDLEWDRIKSLNPITKTVYEFWEQQTEPKYLQFGFGESTGADMFYYLARMPPVIGAEYVPSAEQREEWLRKATDKGHKSAKAALMRLLYLGQSAYGEGSDQALQARIRRNTGKLSPRASRTEYLQAVRLAAEAGDPEFATVMMDTSRNVNSLFHCRHEDQLDTESTNGCDKQDITQPIETKKWAEIAARGGNPDAKSLLCRMHHFGTYTKWGFEQDDQKAFNWCFASEATACSAGYAAGLLQGMYASGNGTVKNLGEAHKPPVSG